MRSKPRKMTVFTTVLFCSLTIFLDAANSATYEHPDPAGGKPYRFEGPNDLTDADVEAIVADFIAEDAAKTEAENKSSIFSGWFGPSNYAECIQGAKGAKTEFAAKMIVADCIERFK